MHKLLKNITYFSILYFVVFVLDTYVKVNLVAFPYRYISKTFLILILLFFYITNSKSENKNRRSLIIIALLCFIFGDIFLIGGASSLTNFVGGVLLFAVAKVLYAIRFSNKQDFNVLKLLPFLVFSFVYMSVIMLLVHENLGIYFVPALIYLLIVMILAQFAFLRKNEVSIKSYWLVLIGVLLSMFSDSITLLKQFYDVEIFYNHYSIMFFYGFSQYFIIVGLLYEKRFKASKAK